VDTERKIFYPEDLARETGLGLSLIYRLLRTGEIKSIRAGDRWLISRSNFEAWANGNQAKTGAC
jgi:excisionase family DNA binding protein